MFVRNELIPLQKRLEQINEWLNDDIIKLETYSLGKE